jgi:hypothetical protein
MDKYINAYELLRHWSIRGIQLFNLCKKGDLQLYNWREEKVINIDSCPKTKKHSFEELTRIARGEELASTVLGANSGLTSEEEFKKEVFREYNTQPDIPTIPKGCVVFDYNLPINNAKAKQKLCKFMEFCREK